MTVSDTIETKAPLSVNHKHIHLWPISSWSAEETSEWSAGGAERVVGVSGSFLQQDKRIKVVQAAGLCVFKKTTKKKREKIANLIQGNLLGSDWKAWKWERSYSLASAGILESGHQWRYNPVVLVRFHSSSWNVLVFGVWQRREDTELNNQNLLLTHLLYMSDAVICCACWGLCVSVCWLISYKWSILRRTSLRTKDCCVGFSRSKQIRQMVNFRAVGHLDGWLSSLNSQCSRQIIRLKKAGQARVWRR